MGCSPEGSAGPGFSWSAAWGAQSFLVCRLRGLGVSWGANGRPLGLGIEFWRAFESWGTMWGLQRSLGCSPGGSLCASQPHLSPSQARGPCSRDPQGAAGGMGQWEPWWGQQGRPGGLGEGTQAADTPLPLWGGGRAPGAPAHLSQENLPTRVLRCSQTIRSFQRFASQPLGADPPEPGWDCRMGTTPWTQAGAGVSCQGHTHLHLGLSSISRPPLPQKTALSKRRPRLKHFGITELSSLMYTYPLLRQ